MKKTLFLGFSAILFVVGCQGKSGETTASSTDAGSPKKEASAPAGGSGFASVQPILTQNCAGCHGENRPRAGIKLTSLDAVMKGGERGPIVKAGDPENSILTQALRGSHGMKKMPPRGSLPEEQIKTVEDWIKAGAKA